MVILVAEVLAFRFLLILGDMYGMFYELVHTFAGSGGDRDDGDTEQTLHLVDTYGTAVTPQLIHHIECQYHRYIQLHQLHGQVEVAFDIVGINDIDDCPGPLVDNEIAGNQLLGSIGRKGVDAREIGDAGVGITLYDTVLAAYRHAGEVAHMLVGTGELIEERGLAAVLLAGKGESQDRVLGQRVLILLGVELAFLSESGMRVVLMQGKIVSEILVQRHFGRFFFRTVLVYNDLERLRKPESQGISMDLYLHRITHRRHLDETHLRTGDDAHVQEMLPEGSLSTDFLHHGGLTYLQIFQSHRILL